MTDAAQQPTLDLGEYRGKNITDTAVKILNQTGGFHPQTDMAEPQIMEMDEEFTIAVRVKVSDHHIKRIMGRGDEEDRLQLLQTWTMGTVAIIPDSGTTKKELDAAERRREAAEKASAKAKEAAKPKRAARSPGADVVPISDSLQQVSDKGFSV